ncbi:MAG: hypothetical protein GEU86_15965 [Actinophytocola sp.]|nr:hypothetical protein [Actinophytocola sp.]
MSPVSRLFAVAVVHLLALFLVPATSAEAAVSSTKAQLRVAPNPVDKGEATTAFGEGFCSSRQCSAVAITLNGATVATVTASKDGSFAARFRPSVDAGQYTVTATQSAPNGGREASTTLVVRAARSTTTATRTTTVTKTTTKTKKPSRTTKSRASSTKRSKTSTSSTTSTTTTTASGVATWPWGSTPDDPTSSAPLLVPEHIADVPRDGGDGFLDVLRWLLPGAVVMLAVIGVAAWRGRSSGSADLPRLR